MNLSERIERVREYDEELARVGGRPGPASPMATAFREDAPVLAEALHWTVECLTLFSKWIRETETLPGETIEDTARRLLARLDFQAEQTVRDLDVISRSPGCFWEGRGSFGGVSEPVR